MIRRYEVTISHTNLTSDEQELLGNRVTDQLSGREVAVSFEGFEGAGLNVAVQKFGEDESPIYIEHVKSTVRDICANFLRLRERYLGVKLPFAAADLHNRTIDLRIKANFRDGTVTGSGEMRVEHREDGQYLLQVVNLSEQAWAASDAKVVFLTRDDIPHLQRCPDGVKDFTCYDPNI